MLYGGFCKFGVLDKGFRAPLKGVWGLLLGRFSADRYGKNCTAVSTRLSEPGAYLGAKWVQRLALEFTRMW